MQFMSYFLSRFCNGGDNVLSLLLGDSWVGGRSAVGQKRPKHKPYDTHCTCTKMSGTKFISEYPQNGEVTQEDFHRLAA